MEGAEQEAPLVPCHPEETSAGSKRDQVVIDLTSGLNKLRFRIIQGAPQAILCELNPCPCCLVLIDDCFVFRNNIKPLSGCCTLWPQHPADGINQTTLCHQWRRVINLALTLQSRRASCEADALWCQHLSDLFPDMIKLGSLTLELVSLLNNPRCFIIDNHGAVTPPRVVCRVLGPASVGGMLSRGLLNSLSNVLALFFVPFLDVSGTE